MGSFPSGSVSSHLQSGTSLCSTASKARLRRSISAETSILMLQDPQFSRGTSSWSSQGNSVVSASSTGGTTGTAAVRLGQGGYIWQALWSGVCHLFSAHQTRQFPAVEYVLLKGASVPWLCCEQQQQQHNGCALIAPDTLWDRRCLWCGARK